MQANIVDPYTGNDAERGLWNAQPLQAKDYAGRGVCAPCLCGDVHTGTGYP